MSRALASIALSRNPPRLCARRSRVKIASFREAHRPLVERAQGFAADITKAIEAELQHGRLTMPIPVRCELPAPSEHGSRAVFHALSRAFRCHSAAILEKALSADSQLVFAWRLIATAIFRCITRSSSQPQRPGDGPGTSRIAANRRIFDDRAGLLAARVIGSSLIQTYNRDMGNGVSVQMKEVGCAPDHPRQHWGGVRMAYRL